LNALDINFEGTLFATGGADTKVRVYDVGKKSSVRILEGTSDFPAHKNRIYALKFSKEMPNLLMTAGWDSMIIFWDLRCLFIKS